jgi:hypothetical protein
MNCRDIDNATAGFLEGTLSAPEREAFESHLAQCPSCRAKMDDSSALRARLVARGKAFSGTSLDARVMETVLNGQMRPRRVDVIYTYAKRIGPLAAAAVIVLTALVIMLWDRPASKAFALEDSIQASKNLKTFRVVVERPVESMRKEFLVDGPMGEMAKKAWADLHIDGKSLMVSGEFWAQFDDAGQLAHLRSDRSVTEDGHKVILWEPGKTVVWFQTKGLRLVTREDGMPEWFPLDFFDPSLVLEKLNKEVSGGMATMTEDTAKVDDETTRLKVVRRDSPDNYDIYIINKTSKLLQAVETYMPRGGKPTFTHVRRFLELNRPIDDSLWRLDVPQDAIVADDLTQIIGLPKGSMTDEQISKEIVTQFWRAVIVKDYDNAGRMLGGISGDRLRQAFGGPLAVTRIVSIGDPYPQPLPGVGGYVVPYEVEMSADGKTGTRKGNAAVRPVDPKTQGDRWVIHGGI